MRNRRRRPASTRARAPAGARKASASATLVLPRATLRMHDNALYANGRAPVLLLLDRARFRMEAPEATPPASVAYSLAQAYFLLKVVRAHALELARRKRHVRIAVTDDPRAVLEEEATRLRAAHGRARVLTDRVHDPEVDWPWLAEVFDAMRVVETRTLVDWRAPAPARLARATFGGSAFRKTRELKRYAHERCGARKPRWARALAAAPGGRPVVDGQADVDALLARLVRAAAAHGVRLYPFDAVFGCATGLDAAVRRFAARAADDVGGAGWHKPSTARNLGLTEYAARAQDNSSKLSPLLSIGALSARTLYAVFAERGARERADPLRAGSATDQLLFRECWYAAASTDAEGRAFWSHAPGWWKARGGARAPTQRALRAHATWADAPPAVRDWYASSMDGRWVDANASMAQLREDGWIHHLRRHVVADVLCLGQLNQAFVYGQLWFRRTLIDHDAVVNRANWMWLAAAAFSTKQTYAHYSPVDYVQRRSAPVHSTVAAARSCRTKGGG